MARHSVITADKHCTILSANHNALKLFGYSIDELVGKKVNLLMPPPYSDQHDTYLARYHTTQKPHVLGRSRIVSALTKNGVIFDTSLSVSEIESSRGTLYIAIFEKPHKKTLTIDISSDGTIYAAKGNVFLTFGYHIDELINRNIICLLVCENSKQETLETLLCDPAIRIHNIQGINKSSGSEINISLQVKKALLRIKKIDGNTTELEGYRLTITPIDNMEAFATLSKHGNIVSASSEFYLLFGYKQVELIGGNISKLVKGNLQEIFTKVTEGNKPTMTKKIVCLHKDGSIFTSVIEIINTVAEEGIDAPDLSGKAFVCKIIKTSSKKKDRDLIEEGEYMGIYQYGKILGSGFFGKVRMAYHRITGEKVAIKTLRKKQYENVNMEYPPREIDVLKALDHPNIYRLYDTVVLDDRIHLVLEYVHGRELCEIVETSALEENYCRELFRKVLLAVDYMHDNGIVHRDLKLENIIITKSGDVKLIDLGFGNFVMSENHLLRTFCGSPDYAAPELFMGKAYNGKHADEWSLGVLLYAMLSGLLPFKNSQAILNGHYSFTNSFPNGAKDLIQKILHKNPNERLPVKGMLSHPWIIKGLSSPIEQPPSSFSLKPDEEVLKQIEELGINALNVKNALSRRETNQLTTTYFLLLGKINRERRDKKENDLKSSSERSLEKLKEKKEDCVLL